MKVLKKGREQAGWATEATCTGEGNGGGGCHAELLVEESDIYTTVAHVRDETDYFMTFRVRSAASRPTSRTYPMTSSSA